MSSPQPHSRDLSFLGRGGQRDPLWSVLCSLPFWSQDIRASLLRVPACPQDGPPRTRTGQTASQGSQGAGRRPEGFPEGAPPGSVPGPYLAGLGLWSPSTSGTSGTGRGQGGLLSAGMMLPAQDPSRTACAWPDVRTRTLVLPETDAPPRGDRGSPSRAAGGRTGRKVRAGVLTRSPCGHSPPQGGRSSWALSKVGDRGPLAPAHWVAEPHGNSQQAPSARARQSRLWPRWAATATGRVRPALT